MRKLLLTFMLALLSAGTLSAQSSDNYKSLLRDASVKIDQTNLPIVFINVNGEEIQKSSYILARMKIIYNGEGKVTYGDTIAHPNQTVDYEGYIALKYRGNTSFGSSDKKPFAFRTLATNILPDDGGAKQKVKILGMGKDNRWATIAPWCDRSMMRDILTFELARPWMDYTPHGRFCEMIIDGTYYGISILMERVSDGKNRLNLNDPGSDGGDLTGDYLVQIDRSDSPYYLSKYYPWSSLTGGEETNKTIKYQYSFPEQEDFAALPTGTQAALQNEIDKMEDSFASSDYTNKDTGYRKYIDVTSFIDYMLATELAMNIDGYRLSTNYYKYSTTHAQASGLDSRWKMALWDFNIAYGNANYYYGTATNQWQYTFNLRASGDTEHVPFYWYKMINDTSYVSQMKARWAAYRKGSYSDEHLTATIDSISNLLTSGGAQQRNEQAWEVFSRTYIWPCPYYPADYTAEIAYLKNWITKRVAFLDKKFLTTIPTDTSTVNAITEPLTVSSGWNADVVAEDTPVSSYYDDRGIDGSLGFYTTYVSADGGLPANGILISPTKAKYNIAYDSPSALHQETANTSAEITFSTSFTTDAIYFLASSGSGASTVGVVVNYTDGTSDNLQTYAINDWSQRAPTGDEAASGLGRASNDDNITSGENCHYAIYENIINVNKAKTVKSLTVIHISGGKSNVMAFSRKVDASTGIRPTFISTKGVQGIYTINGVKVQSLQKGINIVKEADGSTHKVVVP
jgi:hypothetical protein